MTQSKAGGISAPGGLGGGIEGSWRSQDRGSCGGTGLTQSPGTGRAGWISPAQHLRASAPAVFPHAGRRALARCALLRCTFSHLAHAVASEPLWVPWEGAEVLVGQGGAAGAVPHLLLLLPLQHGWDVHVEPCSTSGRGFGSWRDPGRAFAGVLVGLAAGFCWSLGCSPPAPAPGRSVATEQPMPAPCWGAQPRGGPNALGKAATPCSGCPQAQPRALMLPRTKGTKAGAGGLSPAVSPGVSKLPTGGAAPSLWLCTAWLSSAQPGALPLAPAPVSAPASASDPVSAPVPASVPAPAPAEAGTSPSVQPAQLAGSPGSLSCMMGQRSLGCSHLLLGQG